MTERPARGMPFTLHRIPFEVAFAALSILVGVVLASTGHSLTRLEILPLFFVLVIELGLIVGGSATLYGGTRADRSDVDERSGWAWEAAGLVLLASVWSAYGLLLVAIAGVVAFVPAAFALVFAVAAYVRAYTLRRAAAQIRKAAYLLHDEEAP